MKKLKNFKQTGNQYKLTSSNSFNAILCSCFLMLSVFGFIKIPDSSFKWWMLGITILLILSALVSYCIIDMDKKEIRIRMGLIKGPKIIPIANLEGFIIYKIKQLGIITINVSLIANYTINGKKHEAGIAQRLFTRPIQSILNDIEEILGDEYKR
ncbi:hypothetical protein N0B40_05715 [Chryseobacterium oranimense]|uniref:hypothetical protein n=1 Tax=Chryseobacterium oranimense TaxID=421058 RepID=UPI0021AFCB4C|nr:hypothetical protein [Chryseobacterium oranimense]UWX61776.1 hypothetical protein N0B40_05715 [Chryseobacterium oranimense]